jgi:predicted NAD/FAD-binding protein
VASQARLAEIQGTDNLYFAGAWTGHGFHEDGLKSAIAITRTMGFDVPWDTDVAAWQRPVISETREIA